MANNMVNSLNDQLSAADEIARESQRICSVLLGYPAGQFTVGELAWLLWFNQKTRFNTTESQEQNFLNIITGIKIAVDMRKG